jgi:Icc-related predicted phosphoesterase
VLKIAVHSDLHLEFLQFVPNVADADVVILAGDISNNIQDIEWLYNSLQQQASIPVLFIPGNHEYYHNDFEEMNLFFKALDTKYKNFHFMNNRVLPIGEYDFIGSTLWTDFTLGKPASEAEAIAANAIADFKVICYKNKPFSTGDCIQLFRESIKELDDLLYYGSDRQKIVFTHFAIDEKCSAEQYRGSELTAYFTANVKYLIEKYEPKAWVYGHTHHNETGDQESFRIGRTTILSNQRGYPNENIDNYHSDYIYKLRNREESLKHVQDTFAEYGGFSFHNQDFGNHPDNGKKGYWQVIGVRHQALVQTNHAERAIKLAKDSVHEWELSDVKYIGKSLPDVFPC